MVFVPSHLTLATCPCPLFSSLSQLSTLLATTNESVKTVDTRVDSLSTSVADSSHTYSQQVATALAAKADSTELTDLSSAISSIDNNLDSALTTNTNECVPGTPLRRTTTSNCPTPFLPSELQLS